MIKFTKTNKETGVNIEYQIGEDLTINEVLDEFTNFMRACGYTIDYEMQLDLVAIGE